MTTDPRATQPIDVRAVCEKIAEEKLPCNCGAFEATGRHHCECVGYYYEGLIDAFAAHFGPLVEALNFITEITKEELQHAKVGTGCEVALRHANRKSEAALAKLREVNE